MKPSYKIVQNAEFGFHQVMPMPTSEELNDFYNSSYYDSGTYAQKYSENELRQKVFSAHEIMFLTKLKSGRVLDIGCGEGFVLNELHSHGWDVTGLDFSLDGIQRHFPHLSKNVIKGDIYKSLDTLIENQTKFDVIVCNNVLEHVIDPLSFLQRFKSLCHEETVVRIQVPNDFSWLQAALKRDQLIDRDYWVVPPAHLSYFDNESLVKTLTAFGYKVEEMLGDFPIELFLMNKKSSYNMDPQLGPFAHEARLYFDVNLFSTSLEKYIAFRKGCGASGVCRNLIAYCKIS